ncbi:MAG: hypothetical protein K8I65_00175 [Thermoanaerobaculia bacterium]|nr:hypothetical protein [Thermoanaerobaculia bacterium]
MTRPLRALLSLSLLAALACGRDAAREADRRAIETLLAQYATALTAAYESGDPSPIAAVATVREQERVLARIEELAVEGRALRPRLLAQTVTGVDFGNASATAVAMEVWELRVVAAGSELTVSESPRQENQIVYSLIQESGRWIILQRLLKASSEAP